VAKKYPLTVFDIPDSLLVCKLTGDGEINCKIVEMSPEHMLVRLAKDTSVSSERLIFHAFFFEENGYVSFGPFFAERTELTESKFDRTVCYEIESAEYKTMVKDFCKQYQNYIRLKSGSMDNGFSKELVKYPAEKDECFSQSYDEWMDKTGVSDKLHDAIEQVFRERTDIELAVELDNDSKYSSFLEDNYDDKNVFGSLINDKRVDRIYIGNAYCGKLFPEDGTLEKLLEKAKERKMSCTIVLPLMEDGELEDEMKRLETVLKASERYDYLLEIEVNDWGMLRLLQKTDMISEKCEILLGRLLNKRRKDPRYDYKWGWSSLEDKKYNSLDDDSYRLLLKENGIDRFELETCGYEISIPEGKNSLHLPFYQTNTSQYCPMYALKNYGDRGHQKGCKNCPKYCMNHYLMYPDHLLMIGKYNSIYALDIWTLEQIDVLNSYLEKGVDRLVVNI